MSARLIAVCLLAALLHCESLPMALPAEERSITQDCHKLPPAAFDACVLHLLRRLDAIDTAPGEIELIREIRQGDYRVRTYRYCWSDFCRDVQLAPEYDPPWYNVWLERVGVFSAAFLLGAATAGASR